VVVTTDIRGKVVKWLVNLIYSLRTVSDAVPALLRLTSQSYSSLVREQLAYSTEQKRSAGNNKGGTKGANIRASGLSVFLKPQVCVLTSVQNFFNFVYLQFRTSIHRKPFHVVDCGQLYGSLS
jgi:hypothetical protein